MTENLNNEERAFILRTNYIGHLGYIYKDRPFVVPITYFYHEKENRIICYSSDGHKIDALRENSAVSINIAHVHSVNEWKSVLVHGTFNENTGSNAKAILHDFSLGVKEVVLNKELKDLDFINQFSAKLDDGSIPVVFTIEIQEITGKSRSF